MCLHFLYISLIPPVFPFCVAKLGQANKHLQQGGVEVEKHREEKRKPGQVYMWTPVLTFLISHPIKLIFIRNTGSAQQNKTLGKTIWNRMK